MKAVVTPELLETLFHWLADCAAAGRACPGNAEIAKRYDFASAATAAKAIAKLERQGRITVARGWTARQVTIAETGDSTAGIVGTSRMARKPRRPVKQVVTRSSGPRVVGPKGRQCQWIDGEPRGDDSCKCLRETVESESWCPVHRARIFLPPEVADQRFGSIRQLARNRATGRVEN